MAKKRIALEYDTESNRLSISRSGTDGDICALLMAAGSIDESFDKILETAAQKLTERDILNLIRKEKESLLIQKIDMNYE